MRKQMKGYLRDRRWILAGWTLNVMVFAAVFWLFRMPWEAFFYGTGINLSLLLIFLFVDGIRSRERLRKLNSLVRLQDLTGDYLPAGDTNAENAYQRMIKTLCEELKTQRQNFDWQTEDMISYYTLWAHQIKTPIASMGLTVQNEDTPTARRVRADLLRIEQYVEMVLTYLRLDMTETDYVFRLHDLDEILRQALKKYRGEFAARKLSLDYQPVNIQAVTDEKWLSFVVEQVLSNALKYTTEGTISIRSEGEWILCIKDTGPGILPEELPRVFERGYTGTMGRRDKRASGIGLYLAKRICDRLGHKISVASVLDEGTEVRIDFTQNQGDKE